MKAKRYGASDEIIKAYRILILARTNLQTKLISEAMESRNFHSVFPKSWGKVNGIKF